MSTTRGDLHASPRRDRQREELLGSVHRLGLEQIARGGPQSLSMSGIAKILGVSAPALYHYFSSREQLLESIVRDSYQSLTAAQEHATAAAADLPPAQRFRLVVNASRQWMLDNPHRYGLLFHPVPGAEQPSAAELGSVPRRGLAQVIAAVADFVPSGHRLPDEDPQLAAGLSVWRGDESILAGVHPTVLLLGFRMHTRLLGVAHLEVHDIFGGFPVDLSRLWRDEVERVILDIQDAASTSVPDDGNDTAQR